MKVLYQKSDLESYKKNNNLTILYFSASWCGPCKKIYEDLEIIQLKNSNLTIVKIDVDEFKKLALQHNITSVPTFLFYKDNQILHRINGAILKELQEKIAILV